MSSKSTAPAHAEHVTTPVRSNATQTHKKSSFMNETGIRKEICGAFKKHCGILVHPKTLAQYVG